MKFQTILHYGFVVAAIVGGLGLAFAHNWLGMAWCAIALSEHASYRMAQRRADVLSVFVKMYASQRVAR